MSYVGYNPGNIPVAPYCPPPAPPAPPIGPHGKLPNNGFMIGYYGLSTDTAEVIVDNRNRTISVNSKVGGNFVYETSHKMASWEINHNLNKFPNITLVDMANNMIMGEVKYVDLNRVIVSFTEPICGKAFLS